MTHSFPTRRSADLERGEEGFGGGEAFAVGQDRPRFGRIAIDLIGVEQAEGLGEEPAVVAGFIVAAFVALRAKLLPEDAEAGVLALADLRAERLPLAIGAPDPARIAAAIGSRPERDRIYAAIGLAAGDVGRAGDVGAGMMPRHAPGARAGVDRVDDRIGDASIAA